MFGANFILSLVNLVIGLIELLIGLRFVLKLFGANAGTPFVAWINGTSEPLVRPFLGIFPNPVLDGRFLIEFSSLVALIAYALLGYLVSELVATLSYNARRRIVD